MHKDLSKYRLSVYPETGYMLDEAESLRGESLYNIWVFMKYFTEKYYSDGVQWAKEVRDAGLASERYIQIGSFVKNDPVWVLEDRRSLDALSVIKEICVSLGHKYVSDSELNLKLQINSYQLRDCDDDFLREFREIPSDFRYLWHDVKRRTATVINVGDFNNVSYAFDNVSYKKLGHVVISSLIGLLNRNISTMLRLQDERSDQDGWTLKTVENYIAAARFLKANIHREKFIEGLYQDKLIKLSLQEIKDLIDEDNIKGPVYSVLDKDIGLVKYDGRDMSAVNNFYYFNVRNANSVPFVSVLSETPSAEAYGSVHRPGVVMKFDHFDYVRIYSLLCAHKRITDFEVVVSPEDVPLGVLRDRLGVGRDVSLASDVFPAILNTDNS